MKNLFATALVTIVAFYAHSQDGVHLPLTGCTLTGPLTGTTATFNDASSFGKSILITNSSSSANQESSLSLGTYSSNWGYRYTSFKSVLLDPTSGRNRLDLNVADASITGADITALSILSNGNIGVGNANPEFRIDVNGDGRIASSIITNSNSPFSSSSILYSQTGMSNIFGVDGSWSTKYFGLKADGTFVTVGGNVGIGTTEPQGYKLAVAGKIRATEIKVEALPWPDFVFESSYKLPRLQDTEQFIIDNKHLPEIPSAAQVAESGVNLGEMNAKLLQKIEELTLYMIDFDKKTKLMEANVDGLKLENQTLQESIRQLQKTTKLQGIFRSNKL